MPSYWLRQRCCRIHRSASSGFRPIPAQSACSPTPDLGEPYAWDGTVHHHPMFHIAYATGALVTEAYNLRGTSFRLWPDAREHIKRSLLMLAFLSDPVGVFPPNIPGYTRATPGRVWRKWQSHAANGSLRNRRQQRRRRSRARGHLSQLQILTSRTIHMSKNSRGWA